MPWYSNYHFSLFNVGGSVFWNTYKYVSLDELEGEIKVILNSLGTKIQGLDSSSLAIVFTKTVSIYYIVYSISLKILVINSVQTSEPEGHKTVLLYPKN